MLTWNQWVNCVITDQSRPVKVEAGFRSADKSDFYGKASLTGLVLLLLLWLLLMV